MMTDLELDNWFEKNNITLQAREIIIGIRNSEPNRRVQSGRGNVSGFYPSRKMGMTIQFESHKVELPAVYEMEYDSSVLEYYDQPTPVHMEYDSKSGRKVSTLSTPDYFVIKENEATWEEWKTEQQLIELAENAPNRYFKDCEGKWRCPPGERFAEKFGLKYKLRSSEDINWSFQRNIIFLEDFLKKKHEYVICDIKVQVARDIVSSHFGITMKELITNNSIFSLEDLYILIAQEYLYMDLRKNQISEPDKARIFIDQKMSDIHEQIVNVNQTKVEPYIKNQKLIPGSKLMWDSQKYTVLNLGENLVTLVDETDKLINLSNRNLIEMLRNNVLKPIEFEVEVSQEEDYKYILLEGASSRDLEEANKRYQILLEINGGNHVNDYSERTIKRWKKQYEEAQKLYGNGILGLLPKKKNRGNRTVKIDAKVKELIEEVISKHYLTTKQLNMTAAYNILVDLCIKNNQSIPSFVTFTKNIAKMSSHTKALKRKGKRAAYQLQNWHINNNTPKHGERPFEIAHIDHTELDIELVLNVTSRKVTYRPYLTLLVDAYSRMILAHYLTFDSPSVRSNMMVLRECVRKHNRLPQNIVVDGGKEFHSIYFDSMCAQFEITKKTRPPAKARFGSIIERLFGTTNTKFIHNLQGNTQLTKEVRVVTKSVNPKNNALWTLSQLDEIFYEWLQYYHNQIHSSLGISPKEQFEHGLFTGGNRELNFIPYDEVFQLLTLPSTPRGKGLIQPGKGIVYNNIWYWNDEFRTCEKDIVELKYDPYNVGLLYAYVNKRWVKCISEYFYLFKGKSHKELQMITEDIRKKLKHKNNITSRDIVSFINTIEDNENIMRQTMKDRENKRIQMANQNQVEDSLSTNERKVDLTNIPKFNISID